MEEFVIPVIITSDTDIAPCELYTFTLALQRELLDEPVVSVTSAPSAVHELGVKGLGANETQLLVTLGSQILPALIYLLSNWLLRQKDQHLHIKIGEAEIDIPINASPEQVEQIIRILTKAAKQIH
jgi:hypothetical protein